MKKLTHKQQQKKLKKRSQRVKWVKSGGNAIARSDQHRQKSARDSYNWYGSIF